MPERIISCAAAISEALTEEMARDEAIFIIGEDLVAHGGIFGQFKGLPERFLRRILQKLAKSKILFSYKGASGWFSFMAKPEKIYLHNPNLAEALTHSKTNTGTLRETFFINQLSSNYELNYSSQVDRRLCTI